MKRITLVCLILLCGGRAWSQVPDHALGIRLGGSVNAIGAEASYQIGVSDETRLELNAGFGTSTGLTVIKGTGVFHYIGNLGGDFNWYGGPGLSSGTYTLADKGGEYRAFLHICVDLGIDYYFDEVPIQIAVDFRPEYPIGDSYTDGDFDTGLGVAARYILEW